MFLSHKQKSDPDHNTKKLKELVQEYQTLNQAIDAFFKEWDVTEETIARFNQIKEQFTQDAWDTLNKERERLEAKAKKELDQVRDPLEMAKRYRERNIPPQWLFVR